jgi:DNA primase
MNAQELIEKIKYSGYPINELIGKTIELEQIVYYKGICPFCNDKTSSFMVNPQYGFYKCFDCGTGGDIISFIQKMENISFVDAVMKAAKEFGIDVPDDLFQQSTDSEDEDDLPF